MSDIMFSLPAASVFIEFTWWDVYIVGWAVGAPSILLSLLLLWGGPRWCEFDRPRWLWIAITLVLVVAAPLGVLWVTVTVGPDGFLGRTHAYGFVESVAYHWLPGLLTLPPMVLGGLLAWRRWGDRA
jgi:hypothetical protein